MISWHWCGRWEKMKKVIHVFVQEIFTCGILDKKDPIHTASQICLLSTHAPTHKTTGTDRTCFSEYADPVCVVCRHWVCWHVPWNTCAGFHTKQVTCRAAMQNKADRKRSACVSRSSWKKVIFWEQCIYICLFRDVGRLQKKEKKKCSFSKALQK